MHRTLLVPLALLAVLGAAPAAFGATAESPAFTVTPTALPPGGSAVVEGSGLAAGTTWRVALAGDTLGTGTADEAGTVRIPFTVPPTARASGTVALQVVELVSQQTYSVTFTVDSGPAPAPLEPSAGGSSTSAAGTTAAAPARGTVPSEPEGEGNITGWVVLGVGLSVLAASVAIAWRDRRDRQLLSAQAGPPERDDEPVEPRAE